MDTAYKQKWVNQFFSSGKSHDLCYDGALRVLKKLYAVVLNAVA